MTPLATVDFSSYAESVSQALDGIGARDRLRGESAVLIKPNLVNASAHPVTTSLECCKAVIEYVGSCSEANIVIAEGCGDPARETFEIFDVLGYLRLSSRYGIELIDLNEAPVRRLEDKRCRVFPEIYLPEIAFSHFIISVPVLKAHSLAKMTGTLKNMVGFAPPAYYSMGQGWKKAAFHENVHQAIIDLNAYRKPDLSVLDASVGLADFHLGGSHCTPHIGKVVAGFDPLAVDRKGAGLLGLDWKAIDHLKPTG